MTTNKKRALFILRLSFLFTTDNSHYVKLYRLYKFKINTLNSTNTLIDFPKNVTIF